MLEVLSAVVRTLLYAGLLSCAGSVVAAALLRSPELARASQRIIRNSALLTIAAVFASSIILFVRLGAQFDNTTLSAVFVSGSGAAMCLQLAGAGLLLASPNDKSAAGMRLSNAAMMMLSFAFSGHAAAIDLGDGLVAFVHTSAAAGWIGSLWLLRNACIHQPTSVVANVVQRFGDLATRLVGGLIIAGLLLIFILVDFEELPTFSDYEQLLAVKISIVAVVLGVASYNKFRLTPRLANGDATAVSSLRRMIDIELAIIGAILAITAILTTYTSPHD